MRKLLLPLLLLLLPVELSGQDGPAPTLRAGDLLRISVWREPDLSGEFLIDDDGYVILPLIGEFKAADVPLDSLRDSLLAEYQRELRNPSITIIPLRRIYVLGEVNRPGLLSVDPTVSLAGVIALAGGTNPIGDLDRIEIVRDGRRLRSGVAPGVLLTDIDVRSGDQILVGRRSWFDRNSTFIVSALLSVTSIMISLMR